MDLTEKLWGPVASLVKTASFITNTGLDASGNAEEEEDGRGQRDRLGLSGGHWVDELLQFAAWQSLQQFFGTLNQSKIDFLYRRLQTSQLLAIQVKSMQMDRDDPTM